MLKYGIVIPCYNEAHRINETVSKTKKALKGLKNWKIFVINDASTDNIKEVLKEDKKCELISYIFGPSRRENMSKAIHSYICDKCEVVAFMDADLSTDLKDLKKLLTSVSLKTPIVIGNKYASRSRIKRNGFRLLVSRLMNLFTRVLFNTGLDDHFIGFKAFDANVIKVLCQDAGFNNSFRSMFWDAEILIRARWYGYGIRTIPIKWAEGKTTSLKVFKDWKIIVYMIMFRLISWIKKI